MKLKHLKPLFLLLLLFLFGIMNYVIVAASMHEPDYNNQAFISGLSTQEVIDALRDRKIVNILLLSDDQLANALSFDTTLASRLANPDLARAVAANPLLMEVTTIFDDINTRAKADITILNDNPVILQLWYKRFDITAEEGAQLLSYDGMSVTTKGPFSTWFVLESNPGVTVTEDGKLIFQNGIEVGSARVLKTGDYFTIQGGEVFLHMGYAAGSSFVSEGAVVHFAGKRYVVGDEISMNVAILADGIMFRSQDEVTIQEEIEVGKTEASFTGGLLFFYDHHIMLEPKTTFNDFVGEGAVHVTVNDKTNYYTTSTGCSTAYQTFSCIERDGLTLRVTVVRDAEVEITDELGLDMVAISPIAVGESGKVTYRKGEIGEAIFSSDPVKLKGDLSLLPVFAVGSHDRLYGSNVVYTFIGRQQYPDVSLGTTIAANAQELYTKYLDLLAERRVGTHYGAKSMYNWLLQPPIPGKPSEYGRWTSGVGGGFGLNHQEALFVTLLDSLPPEHPLYSYEALIAEAKLIGKRLITVEQIAAYASLRRKEDGASPEELVSRVLEERPTPSDSREIKSGFPVRTSCIELCESILRSSHQEAGKSEEYSSVRETYLQSQARGTKLAQALQEQGWKVIFMAPDSKNPGWSNPQHIAAITQVMSGQKWYGEISVDAVVTDFNPSEQRRDISTGASSPLSTETMTNRDEIAYRKLLESNVNGGFIVAAGGEHTGILMRDPVSGQLQVLENHYSYGPESGATLEASDLAEFDWGTFILVVPPDADVSKLPTVLQKLAMNEQGISGG